MADDLTRTQSGLYVPPGAIEAKGPGADEAVVRWVDAMTKLERTFPQLVAAVAALVNQADQLARQKGLALQALAFSTPRWNTGGAIVFNVLIDPTAKPDRSAAGAVAHYKNLQDIFKTCPQAVELGMAIGTQLVVYCNQHKIKPAEIEIERPRWGERAEVVLRVKRLGKGFAPGELHL